MFGVDVEVLLNKCMDKVGSGAFVFFITYHICATSTAQLSPLLTLMLLLLLSVAVMIILNLVTALIVEYYHESMGGESRVRACCTLLLWSMKFLLLLCIAISPMLTSFYVRFYCFIDEFGE